jgi:hypothetical protein
MAIHGKHQKLVPFAVLFAAVAAAASGCAVGGSHAPEAAKLADNASVVTSRELAVYACLAPAKAERVSADTPKCPAHTVLADWSAQSGPVRASGRQLVVYACLAPDKLASVSVTAPKCPAHSVLVHWVARSGPATSSGPAPRVSPSSGASTKAPKSPASSAPPTTSPSSPSPSDQPSPAPTAPSPSSAGAACVTSADNGSCGPYDFPGISASSGSNTNVIQDVWNPISGASQTLTAVSPDDWSVVANMPASNTAVVSYPDIQQLYTTDSDTPDPLSSFSSITSSFAESGPGSGGGDDYEAAYDIWAGTGSNDYAQEIMIWVDNHGQTPAGSQVATADVDGTSYSIWSAGDNPVSMVLSSNETSGTVNILAALDWLESHGYMPAGSGLNQIDFGWEICSTGGTAKTFRITEYGIQSS